MPTKMQKLFSLLPNSGISKTQSSCSSSSVTGTNKQKTNQKMNNLEPEIGFQISIEFNEHSVNNSINNGTGEMATITPATMATSHNTMKTIVPELNVHLIAARHLPALFGFKIVQGYMIKVKLFPGSKRLDSSIQTNSWPKFNEHFKFPLTPEVKPSLKQQQQHISHRGSKSTVRELTPQELFAGQFVVFTVYALLELPPTTFNRFSKTYRSLKDKSSNLMQNIFDNNTSTATAANEKDNRTNNCTKRKSMDCNGNGMPILTISESRRNLGSVTCYLEPKIFQRNSKGIYSTEELWLPIKDITTTIGTSTTIANNNSTANNNNNNLGNNISNNLNNAPKGVVELVMELKENSKTLSVDATDDGSNNHPSTTEECNSNHGQSWHRMTSQVKRKMGMSNIKAKMKMHCPLVLKVTTTRMRCSNKAKDELEYTAGTVYVKTSVFENGVYLDSWKSSYFYPSLSTKWTTISPSLKGQLTKEKSKYDKEYATITIPIRNYENLNDILIKTTLATKTKIGKKFILGTVVIGNFNSTHNNINTDGESGDYDNGHLNKLHSIQESGMEHMKLLRQSSLKEPISMWHCYQ